MSQFEQVEILLVEDNPLDAELTTRALKNGGLANKLFWVKDGQEALDLVYCRGTHAGRAPSSAVPLARSGVLARSSWSRGADA